MTKEGRLVRGKENYDNKKFLVIQETIDYLATLNTPKAKKPEEAKDAKQSK